MARETDAEVRHMVREAVDFMLDMVHLVAPRCLRRLSLDADSADPTGRTAPPPAKRPRLEEKRQTEEEEGDQALALVAVPSVPVTLSLQKRRSCVICDSTRLAYLAIRRGKYEHLCSEACVERYKKFRNQPPCLSCGRELDLGRCGYRPNYGVIGQAVCSIPCLQQYDARFGPKAKCRNGRCAQPVPRPAGTGAAGSGASGGSSSITVTYHWQSMDFCSAACVSELVRAVGAKCTQCRSLVPLPSIGKYSVRFGDVVRQFCSAACLKGYKKANRSCTFCQTEIKSGSLSRPVERDFGEGSRIFCNNVCADDYIRSEADKRLAREMDASVAGSCGGNFCDVCLCYFPVDSPSSPDHLTFRTATDDVVFLCSTTCASAYRFVLLLRSSLLA